MDAVTYDRKILSLQQRLFDFQKKMSQIEKMEQEGKVLASQLKSWIDNKRGIENEIKILTNERDAKNNLFHIVKEATNVSNVDVLHAIEDSLNYLLTIEKLRQGDGLFINKFDKTVDTIEYIVSNTSDKDVVEKADSVFKSIRDLSDNFSNTSVHHYMMVSCLHLLAVINKAEERLEYI